MKQNSLNRFEEFRAVAGPILDVRSPVEFEHGHIPDAINFPLFTDEERDAVGISYKKKGRSAAIRLGFDLVGPRLGDMIREAGRISPEKTVRVHCSRGGLRSRSVAWLLKTAGFQVVTLEGGYKSYRRWVRDIVSVPRRINILGGLTGSGKTHILTALQGQDEQVLNLEGLANHRGSSFGGLGMPVQPSTQHFENLIAEELVLQNSERRVWIEAESGRVGTCWVPEELFAQMKTASAIQIVRPIEERLDILTEMYGGTDRSGLIGATKRISKNLGGERTKAAVDLIRQGDIREACQIILDYYDRTYRASRKRRPMESPEIDVSGLSSAEAASLLIKRAPSLLQKAVGSMTT